VGGKCCWQARQARSGQGGGTPTARHIINLHQDKRWAWSGTTTTTIHPGRRMRVERRREYGGIAMEEDDGGCRNSEWKKMRILRWHAISICS
jgi:hypothetical protein